MKMSWLDVVWHVFCWGYHSCAQTVLVVTSQFLYHVYYDMDCDLLFSLAWETKSSYLLHILDCCGLNGDTDDLKGLFLVSVQLLGVDQDLHSKQFKCHSYGYSSFSAYYLSFGIHIIFSISTLKSSLKKHFFCHYFH